MSIARAELAPSQRLTERASTALGRVFRRRAERDEPSALSDDSRRQLQRERLLAQARLERLTLAARRPL
jgi:hypothetical protein